MKVTGQDTVHVLPVLLGEAYTAHVESTAPQYYALVPELPLWSPLGNPEVRWMRHSANNFFHVELHCTAAGSKTIMLTHRSHMKPLLLAAVVLLQLCAAAQDWDQLLCSVGIRCSDRWRTLAAFMTRRARAML